MKRNANTSKLTKAFIESRVSQEEIVSKYLDIPLEVVRDCVEHNHLITSVFFTRLNPLDIISSMSLISKGIYANIRGFPKNFCFVLLTPI